MRPLPNTAATVSKTEPTPETTSPNVDPSGDERPVLESRRRRASAYLRHNGERICRDAAMLVAWALLTTIWMKGFGLPRWLCYLVAFVGVVGYTQVTSPWVRPYMSPDDLER